ncbi:phospholipase D-like domain-containing protein [Natronococcus occultus]|uniref:Phosphatidylserine/phosphatidylglycerophosphate/ cardiolipin synthase n=1 Tax=Natronococcus occultus SP4 TaxID=694430 RepID=L0JUI9_9EURY|nr:phospholipase D-like domain-containing protein [Natronococcus occultus]AGB36692.1 phosphatidylserine/phosphatidylglycerophosphate/cardiolipin synthase [Natronococcus occultus SP4]
MVRRRVALALAATLVLVAGLGLPLATAFGAGAAPEPGVADSHGEHTQPSDGVDADLACPIPNGSVGDRDPDVGSRPRIVELYPNPTTYGNVGEYLVLETSTATDLGNLSLTDGHTTAALPNETVSGRVALTTAPEETRELTDDPVLELEGTVRLAADGDELELRDGNGVVDAVAYDRASTAERWYRTPDDEHGTADAPVRGEWWPRGATCRPVATADVDDATPFVLPDSPDLPRETIRGADERLLLAGYTITDEAIAADLVAAAERGVEVNVVLESGPVGGVPSTTEDVLAELDRGGVDVRVLGGEGARYRFHHPKYAVADDDVLVTTENWKPAGIGGESSRGWGVHVEDADLAAELAAVFRTDFDGRDTVSGSSFRENASFVEDDGAPPQEFPTSHEPETVPIEAVELLLAPENAEPRLRDLIDGADDELLIKQASIADDVGLLEATVEAARRGVDVRILVDSSWYVEDDHEALARELERTADEEELSLDVELVDDTDAFEKIHAKGIVVDREIAVVGSANWTENSLRNNREVLLAIHGSEAASYYAAVFEDDWDGETWSLPIELSAAVLVALVCAAVVGHRYVEFGSE